MTNDIKLDRLDSKLDDLCSAQNDIKICIAEQKTHNKNYQKVMERFWNNTWPDVIEKIDSNSTRIATIEVDLARIKTMVVVWGSLLSVLVAISIPFISYYLDR